MNDFYGYSGHFDPAMSAHRNAAPGGESVRQSGLAAVGAIPWGTHFCHFYATDRDLVETLVPYFREGLAANEFCMWITSAPLAVEEATAALRAAVPDLNDRLARRQIEILDYSQWYTKTGNFDARAVLQSWADKSADARRRGFDGLRLSGNTSWLETAVWHDFRHYEDMVHGMIGDLRVLALCSYSLEKCGLREILEVAASHDFALVKNSGRWETIRSIEHQAESALRESRERLERFAEITSEGILISENGKVVDCNQQFARLTGYPLQELKGMPIGAFIPPEERGRILENVTLGRDSYEEHAMVRQDGSRLFVAARGKNSTRAAGQRYTAVRDITERKLMEEAGREARQALERERNILQSVMNGARNAHLVYLDRDFNFVRVNEAYARTCGYAPDELIGKNHFAIFPHPENEAIFAHVRDTGEAVEYHDKPFVFPDQPERGVTYWDWTLFPVSGSAGQVDGLVFSLLETTDRKRAEDALKESEERFRAMIQAVPSLTFEADPAGLSSFVSESWCAYTGMSVAASAGWGWAQAVHPEDREAVAASWAEATRSGTLFECKYRLRAHDDSYRWFIVRALPTRDAAGKATHWAGSLTDVDDLVRAQQSLCEADRRKDEFLAMLAHELRNPLAPIRNAAHIIGRLGLQEPRIKWAQEVIENQVSHLAHLVDDLLDVSRIVRGKIALKMEAVEFAPLAEKVIESALLLANKKGHSFAVRLPEQPVWLEGDPVRLSQVLLNLMDNAIKYTPEGGKIELDAQLAEGELEICVRDNGMGIGAELLPRVFDLFQQDERTLDRAQGGLGLGLTLVQRLVAKHGGRVEARSEGPGKGSAFVIRLPIGAEPTAPLAERAPTVGDAALGTGILVVDDNLDVADSMAVLLEMEGYRVGVAHSGPEALALIPAFKPRVVVLDIGLKGMDGFETAKRLRALADGRGVRIVAMTGYADAETRNLALASGCNGFMAKPMDVGALCKLLAGFARNERE